MLFNRNRTPITKNIYYALHPYCSGLSLIKKSITTAALVSLYKKVTIYPFGIGFSITSQKRYPIAKGEL